MFKLSALHFNSHINTHAYHLSNLPGVRDVIVCFKQLWDSGALGLIREGTSYVQTTYQISRLNISYIRQIYINEGWSQPSTLGSVRLHNHSAL